MYQWHFTIACLISLSCYPSFQPRVIHNGYLSTEVEVGILNNTQDLIGTITYLQIPFSIYILHSFFIDPAFRNKGYGTRLLEHVIQLITKRSPRLILVQPGPFELKNGQVQNLTPGPGREQYLHKITAFYARNGFQPAPSVLRKFSHLLYRIIGINEDPQYLMTIRPKKKHK